MNSFRFKIAFLSATITLVLLIGSGAILWELTSRMELARVDRELRNLGVPHLERVVGGDHWARFESALKFVEGTNTLPTYVLWVRIEDRVVYQSPHWPDDLDAGSFPVLTAYEGPDAPRPGEPRPPPPRRGEEISPRNPPLPRMVPQFSTRHADGRNWRLGVMGNPYTTLILGVDLTESQMGMQQLRRTYLLALLVALAIASGGAWHLAGRALRPVNALTETARQVTARGLEQRIPAMARDREFNQLVMVFNDMLDRLEVSFRQATRFSADASHELKSPLARLQIELEQAVEKATEGSPEQSVFGSLLDEICRLKAIVQKLLLLSLADAGRLDLRLVPTDLSGMVLNVVEDCRAQAPGLEVTEAVTPRILVPADQELLEQALQNLASNAIKHNRPGGSIHFETSACGNVAVVRVTNTGPSIPPEQQPRLFERFFRGDPSRSGRVEGVGLGLSLSREILRAHHGDLTLQVSAEDRTVFVANVPIATPGKKP